MFRKIGRAKSYIKYKYDIYTNRVKHAKILGSIKDPIFVDGHPDSKNFGDALNIFLVEFLSGKNVFPSKYILKTKYNDDLSYSVIGSICQWTREKSVVWGSGFIQDAYSEDSFVKPKRVTAVRGPLTREIYLKNGIECPEIYGDPALLLPLIYNPENIEAKYEFGIIPHYTEINLPWVKDVQNREDVLFIDIMIGANYEKFVTEIKSCKKIITSSLHGLIFCHAYRIPVSQIKLSNQLTGGDFKFYDYLLSVNKTPHKPIDISTQFISIDHLDFDSEPIRFDIKPLINSCPFILDDIRNQLLIVSDYYENS